MTLLLALTDQFGHAYKMSEVQPRADRGLSDPYERAYYAGIVAERQADAILDQGVQNSSFRAHDLLSEAMRYYEEAERIRPAGNDDALLRWNTCRGMMNSTGVNPQTL